MLPRNIKLNIKFAIYYIVALLIKVYYSPPKQKKGVLLVKTDGIGDYIMFRNFIPFFKKHYLSEPITLLCPKTIIDFASTIDARSTDHILYLSQTDFDKNLPYIFNFFKRIRLEGYNITIYPSFSRSPEIDLISYVSGAETSIAFHGDLNNSNLLIKKITQTFYNKLIQSPNEPIFEFYRLKYFTESVTNQLTQIQKPAIQLNSSTNSHAKQPYIVIFPGSSQIQTQWPVSKFSQLINILLTQYNYTIIICGSIIDLASANIIINNCISDRIINYCGKTNIIEFAHILKNAHLLISNDTSAIHIAAAVDTPFVCISSGRHFGRYTPYPAEMNVNAAYVYPDVKFYQSNQFDYLAKLYSHASDYSVDDIEIDSVIRKIAELKFNDAQSG